MSAVTLRRISRTAFVGRPVYFCTADGVLLYRSADGRIDLAETITAEHPDGRRWMLTRHEARSHGGVYWLATPLRQDGGLELPRGLTGSTQYEARTLAALVDVLETVPTEPAERAQPYIAPLRDVGSVTPTRPIARPSVTAGAEHPYDERSL